MRARANENYFDINLQQIKSRVRCDWPPHLLIVDTEMSAEAESGRAKFSSDFYTRTGRLDFSNIIVYGSQGRIVVLKTQPPLSTLTLLSKDLSLPVKSLFYFCSLF